MNCTEFQEILPDVLEADRTPELESHLKSCPACSNLVAELDLIVSEARQLQDVADPDPRVWASIEIALRQEGIIRDPQLGPTLVPDVPRRWNLAAWLMPVAVVALVAFGIFVYERGSSKPQLTATLSPTVSVERSNPQTSRDAATMENNRNNNEDQQLLAAVASRSPAMQAQYASNLQNVNAYIHDAEESAQADPNDEEAQQIVMDAYEQRAAVYEMALDRSLP
jgi:hypothetical protein